MDLFVKSNLQSNLGRMSVQVLNNPTSTTSHLKKHETEDAPRASFLNVSGGGNCEAISDECIIDANASMMTFCTLYFLHFLSETNVNFLGQKVHPLVIGFYSSWKLFTRELEEL
jgi:hypothetical protein